MWYPASLALLVVTLLYVPTAEQQRKTRAEVKKRPYARILESRILPSGALRIVVPYEDTFIRNGRRVARVKSYYCKKKILEVNAGREFYTMGFCRPIVVYRRTNGGTTTMPPVSTEVTAVNEDTTDTASSTTAEVTNEPALEITTDSATMSTTASQLPTDVTTEASTVTTSQAPTESSSSTATEEAQGDAITSAATESMATTSTMLESTTTDATAAAVFKYNAEALPVNKVSRL